MHVRIGPYRDFSLADAIYRMFGSPTPPDPDAASWRWRWQQRVKRFVCGTNTRPSWASKLSHKLSSKFSGRNIYVYVDDYDVWNMDDTLKHIIHPMLVKLRESKQGSGFVDDCDVPEHLQSTQPGARDGCESWDIDHYFHQRYQWMLDEITWAFDPDCTEQDYTDPVAYELTEQRKLNAYRLFGRYYHTLWT